MGQGCRASHQRLAEMTGLNLSTISTTIKDLAGWGYITGEMHPINHRTRVYRVTYNDQDLAAAKRSTPISGPRTITDSLPTGKVLSRFDAVTGELAANDTDTLPTRNNVVPMVCLSQNLKEEDQGDKVGNIFCETGIDFLKGKIDSVETAPPRVGVVAQKRSCSNPGAFLAIVERGLKEGGHLDQPTEQALEKIIAEYDYSDPEHQQAQRILETYGAAA
jgi:DNA-binding MarR family transcriptional regulator